MDIDQIEPGEDFVEVINRKVVTCDIAIVAIGPHWLSATDQSGKRRLDDEEDFVRMEIVAALQRNIRVIPVLVDGARMPGRHDLPEALAPLSRRNAIELSETRFHADVNRLIEAIEKSFVVAEKKVKLSATPAAPPPEPATVRPPESESKDLPEPSESTKRAEPKEPKQIYVHAVSEATPASLVETPKPFPIRAARPNSVSERSQQDSVATANDLTTAAKSTQTTPAPTPVPSTSSIAALKKPKVWTWERRILDGAIVFLLLALAAVFMWSRHQKAPQQSNQPAIANLNTPSKPAELTWNVLPWANDFDRVKKNADQGNAQAQYLLGSNYEYGFGNVPQDLGKAAEFYQKAADQGNPDGQYNLGRLYENGWGVPTDLKKAEELYKKAAGQGHRDAGERWLQLIAKNLRA
jgi:hypothetical protein